MKNLNEEKSRIQKNEEPEINHHLSKCIERDITFLKSIEPEKKNYGSINLKGEICLLKLLEALVIIPVSKSTFYRLIKKNPILKQIKIGRSSFWNKYVLLQFIDNCKEVENV